MTQRTYRVEYALWQNSPVKAIVVHANNMAEAYDKAFYEAIPTRENVIPYSAWVESVWYANGKGKRFNTFEGKPY